MVWFWGERRRRRRRRRRARDGGDGKRRCDNAPNLLLRCGGRQGRLLLLRVEREQPREHARRALHRAPRFSRVARRSGGGLRVSLFESWGEELSAPCRCRALDAGGGAERSGCVCCLSVCGSARREEERSRGVLRSEKVWEGFHQAIHSFPLHQARLPHDSRPKTSHMSRPPHPFHGRRSIHKLA